MSSSSNRKFGLAGLGNMGASMAANLLKANPGNVVVYDISKDSVSALVEKGASAASSPADLARRCDVLITMVPATQHVSGLLRGPDGMFANAKKGSLFIDCSTIDPIASKELCAEAKKMGLNMIDAPVSGGVTGAAAGTLTFMVGGTAEDLDSARPALGAMGKNIVHCGPAGTGGVTKLANNLALAISMIGTAEAMTLGTKLGMDPKVLASVMNTSTARCWSSDSYNPVPGVMPNVPSSRDYSGGFGSALMEKDLTLAMDASKSVKARLPLGASAHQLYGLLCQHGFGGKDFSSVYEFLNKK